MLHDINPDLYWNDFIQYSKCKNMIFCNARLCPIVSVVTLNEINDRPYYAIEWLRLLINSISSNLCYRQNTVINNFRKKSRVLPGLVVTHARNESHHSDHSNVEVIARVEVVVTSFFTFHAISEKNCHWRGLARYGFRDDRHECSLSWVNHWWIGDEVVGLCSCDQTLFFCTVLKSFPSSAHPLFPYLSSRNPVCFCPLWSLMQNTMNYDLLRCGLPISAVVFTLCTPRLG